MIRLGAAPTALLERKRLAIEERAVTPINPDRDHVTQYPYAQLFISGYTLKRWRSMNSVLRDV